MLYSSDCHAPYHSLDSVSPWGHSSRDAKAASWHKSLVQMVCCWSRRHQRIFLRSDLLAGKAMEKLRHLYDIIYYSYSSIWRSEDSEGFYIFWLCPAEVQESGDKARLGFAFCNDLCRFRELWIPQSKSQVFRLVLCFFKQQTYSFWYKAVSISFGYFGKVRLERHEMYCCGNTLQTACCVCKSHQISTLLTCR